jgi:hypothetical protein
MVWCVPDQSGAVQTEMLLFLQQLVLDEGFINTP